MSDVQKPGLTTNGLDKWHGAVIFAALGMIVTSIYLTNHYFEFFFPEKLGGSGLCDINSFFSCDSATNSPFSNIMGIPISIFGILNGIFLLIGAIFASEKFERTNYLVQTVNTLGCVFLFFYSLIGLGGLCPFCTLYYLFSGLAFYAFYRRSQMGAPDIVPSIIMIVFTLSAAGIGKYVYDDKMEARGKIAVSLLKQFKELPDLGLPQKESPHKIAKATEAFSEGPIQLSIFSDFQCPSCKLLSDMVHPIVKKYKGSVNIQYFFYPLDSNCNASMQRQIHPLACKGAYLAHCAGDKFVEVHDAIFENQRSLSNEYLDNYAKELGVTECMNSPETKDVVVKMIEQAADFNVRSTPTVLLNGVKIEGAIPLAQFYILLDHLVETRGKK